MSGGLLTTFLAVKDTRPAGSGVIPTLAVVFALSGLLSLFLWLRARESSPAAGDQTGGSITAGANVDTGHGDFRGNVITDSTVNFRTVVEPVSDNPPARQIVDVTSRQLVGFFEGQTAIQAHKLTEAFIGKWMRHSGRLSDVGKWMGDSDRGFCNVTFETLVVGERLGQWHGVYMFFRDREYVENRLAVLGKGTELTVVGQIDEVTASSVQLENCELVD